MQAPLPACCVHTLAAHLLRHPEQAGQMLAAVLEAVSDRKHEFIDGAIIAIAGAQPPHDAIAANVTAALVQLTRGRGCVTLTSDQRIHVPATGLIALSDVYADVDFDEGKPGSTPR